MAATQASKVNGNTDTGTNIMVAGIVFQLFTITVFVALAADFVRRCLQHRELLPHLVDRDPRKSLRPAIILFAATTFSIACVYVRCIYRTIELAQGWDGDLISQEKYFIAMDGAMMAPCVIVFNIFHPGWLLPPGAGNLHHAHKKKGHADDPNDDGDDHDKQAEASPDGYPDEGKGTTI